MDELTRTTANKVRIEGELQIARNIQMGMLPQVFPPFPERKDIDLYASMVPAREVGGDLYDYFIQGSRLYFCIGDVSGKGVPASLFMTVVQNLFRAAGQQGLLPAEIAHRINETLADRNEQLMFVTMFIGAIDLETGKNHGKCGLYLKISKVIHHPRYGCGLCQTKVPCEHCIPPKRKNT